MKRMKSYLDLVPASARVHKRQSRMTRICIVLAVFLVTAIFSMTEMWIRSEMAVLTRKHGNYQAITTAVKNVYPLAVICFLLILLAGILMIAGCMNSNVAQRTRFFGTLRCIGASRQQIIRFVRLEALNWCKTAIPIGCLLGMLSCWICCAILRLFVKGEWADMPLFGVSVSGIVCGIAVGVITVFLAAGAPARLAAKVSPIAAVSGNAESTKIVRRAANTRFFKVETSLGIHHATAAKKNLFLMTGSFALTIALFLVFSACFDLVRRMLPSESSFLPDMTVASQDEGNSIEKDLAAQIAGIPGVAHAFGTMYAVGLPVRINGEETVIDLVSYEEFMFGNTKKAVASGKLSETYGDSDYVLTIFGENSRLDVGDRITIGGSEVEVACVASEGIGSLSDSAVVVCSEETFARLLGEQGYMMINVILEKDATQETEMQIRSLADGCAFVDRRTEDKEMHSSYWVFRIAVYGFLAIIAVITILNIMNSVSMGVSARIRQYGAMRAVGMESRQITKMIMGEAFTYALCGTVVGLSIGLILHYAIYLKLIVTHFGGRWILPFPAIVMIFLFVSASCAAAVYVPAGRIRRMSVTAAINEL